MKKVFSVLLVAALTASTVFAAFSGSANIGLGANFDNGEYGFINKSTSVTFNVDLATATAEKIAEGDVYASIKGSLKLFLASDADGTDPVDTSIISISTSKGEYGIGLGVSIDEAKVAGENWYVSILGVPSVNDFAKSAIDTWTVEDEKDDYGILKADYDKNASYKVGYEKAPGVEVGIYDYVVGLGFKAKAVKTPEFDPFNSYALSAYMKTPEYALAEGLTIQAGSSYSLAKAPAKFIGNDEALDKNAVGGSLKVAYASDVLSASVATDLGYDIKAEDFGADVAANVKYDFISADAYYATKVTVNKDTVENLLSVKAATDLNSFNVPLVVTFTGKDLVNKQDLGLKTEVAVAGVKLTPSVGYVVKTDVFKAGLDAEYATDMFTAKAGVSTETTKWNGDTLKLGASASIATEALIPGAELKLAWADANDLLNVEKDSVETYGKITASCKIKF